MAQHKGTFIAIESPVASYAASHGQQLRNRLEVAGYEVVYFSFPQTGEPSSYFADRYTEGSYGDDIIPYAGSLFFALDHFEASDNIRQALDAGKIVIAHKYLGANMVEQGAKLKNPDERRGYFLWLDNLESQVLRAPRPDRSLVLSISASRAKSLQADTEPSVPTDKQTALYSELCDLYPKDFVRVDTERNGKILDDKHVQDILWALTEPLLPELRSPKVILTTGSSFKLNKIIDSPIPTTVIELSVTNYLASQIISHTTASYKQSFPDYIEEMANVEHYLTPAYFEGQLATDYLNGMGHLLKNYQLIHERLEKYLKSTQGQSEDDITIALGVLPLATRTKLELQLNDKQLKELFINLLSNEQPEAWSLGQELLKANHELTPTSTVNAGDIAYQASRERTMRKYAHDLNRVHAADQSETVHLRTVSPRNEYDLLPYMLYEQSNLPLKDIELAISGWQFEQKQAVFVAYCNNRTTSLQTPGNAFRHAHYEWDLLAEYGELASINNAGLATMSFQALTPRYGYQIPALIEDAGLADIYEDSFDLSMHLFSDLQQAGYELEAQYVTLMGHKQRCLMELNGKQLIQQIEELGPKALGIALQAKLNELHPNLATLIATATPTNSKSQTNAKSTSKTQR